jgi:hypothetical protein
MKVKNKKSSSLGHSCKFNIHGLGEIIVVFDEGDCSSEYIKDYDVFIESQKAWRDMGEAFKNNLIISDNYNIDFREPINSIEKERGWYY